MNTTSEILGLSDAAIESRLAVLDLTPADRGRLAHIAPQLEAGADAFIDGLYERLTRFPHTAAWFQRDGVVDRLKRQQRQYLHELLTNPITPAYVEGRLRIGTTHHRVRLTPRWYVVTCAHFVTEHAQPILDACPNAQDGIETFIAFLKSILFDASLILDAYGMSLEEALRSDPPPHPSPHNAHIAEDPAASGVADRDRRPSNPISRLPTTSDDCADRASFLAIDETTQRTLRTLEPLFQTAVPEMLQEFYAVFSSLPQTVALLPEPTIRRLLSQVSSYWHELIQSRFDRPYSISRTRIGVIHEQLGIGPQLYLVALARQLASLLRTVFREHPEPRTAAQAILKAAFFDISFVMDAYMDARANAVLRSEGYASQLLACLTVGVAVLDPQLRVRSANPALLKLLGAEAGVIRHMHVSDLMPDPRVVAMVTRSKADPDRRESLQTRFGGRQLRVSTIRMTAPAEAGAPSQLAVVVDDITDLVGVAPEMERIEHQLWETVSAIDAVIWEADPEAWSLTLVSTPVLALTGLRDVHFLGRPHAWPERIPQPDRERFLQRCARLRALERCEIVHRILHVDGSSRWVRSHVVRSGLAPAASVFHGVSIDITTSFTAERRRLDAIGRLSGSVAHEFNSVLTVVSGALGIVAETADAETAAILDSARHAIARGAGLTRQLQSFAQGHPLRPRPTLLNQSVETVRGTLEKLLGTDIQLQIEPSQDLWWCQLDPVQFEESLISLATNAREAMPQGGRVRINTRNLRGEEIAPAPGSVGEGDHVELAISDSGEGMCDEVRLRSIEPFFTTKSSAVGLGLSVVHGFVAQSRGQVVIESGVAQGTTVRLRFPRFHPASGSPPPGPSGTAKRTVLVVDDDEAVALVFRRVLQRRNFEVRLAATPEEAKASLAKGLPDLVITDVVFGNVPLGVGLAREIRAAHPGLPVLFTSGYTKASLDLRDDELFLPKPFEFAELDALLARCLR